MGNRLKGGPVRSIFRAASDALASMPACCGHNGFTYLIRAADRIKIGQSVEPAKRLVGLQSSCPVPLELVALCRDVSFERALHIRLSDCRAHGEWFDANTVLDTLRMSFARSRGHGVCLRCADDLTAADTTRAVYSAKAGPVGISECGCAEGTRGPIGWIGLGSVDWGCKRSASFVYERDGIDADMVASLASDDWRRLPTKDLLDLRRFKVGCILCALRRGDAKMSAHARTLLAVHFHGSYMAPGLFDELQALYAQADRCAA